MNEETICERSIDICDGESPEIVRLMDALKVDYKSKLVKRFSLSLPEAHEHLTLDVTYLVTKEQVRATADVLSDFGEFHQTEHPDPTSSANQKKNLLRTLVERITSLWTR